MLDSLKSQFGEAIESAEQVGRELRLRLAAGAVVELARYCRNQGYTYLGDITAADTGSELRVVYRLISLASGQHIVISVGTPRAGARLPTLTGVYRGAEWPEREVYDLFGVRFDGHPDLRRILLTEDWEGHPLLKTWSPSK